MAKHSSWNKGTGQGTESSLEIPGGAGFCEARLRTFAESYVADFCIATLILLGVALISGLSALLRYLGDQWAAPYIEWVVYVTGLVIIGLFSLDFVAKLVMSIVRSPGAQAPRIPEHTGFGGYYDRHIRESAESWIADIVKCVMVLVGVGVWELYTRGLQLMGFPHDRAIVFENVDQCVAGLVATVVCFSAIARAARFLPLHKDDLNVR